LTYLINFSEREKSATKEAINLLHKFLNDDTISKRRRLDNKDGVGEVTTDLSLVKLIRNGLVLFIFPKDTYHDTVPIVSNIIQALESGKITLPL